MGMDKLLKVETDTKEGASMVKAARKRVDLLEAELVRKPGAHAAFG